jgi:hypothetical protein
LDLFGKIQICYQCEHLPFFVYIILNTQFLDGHRITDIGFFDGIEFRAL